MNSTIRNRLTPKNVGDWIKNNTNILLMFVLIIVGAIVSENFFKASNLFNVLRQITVNGMLAVACTMTLLVNGFDLSIGHNMALCAVLCIGFEKSYGGVAAIIVALAAGATMGLVNGLLVKLTRGESSEGFMITLASGMMAQALAKWYCGGSEIIRPQIPESQDWFRVLGQGNTIGGFPVCALIWIAVMVILQIIVKKTTFGRKMLLSGANKKSAYLAGINVGAIKVIAYTVAGLCCGIAAIIYAARFNSANDGSGTGGDFNGAVISIIGGNALYGGHGGMVQVFIGAVTFGLITNILQLMGIGSAVQFIVQGAILLLAINLDRLKKR
ncbi:MAG: ABC transporter permease [Ruminococcaceae bacterium]|nr:ABC transporter permease [Oscillospiraceae bacterium]